MQRAAARVASLAFRRFASSASRPTAVASLLPATSVLSARTRLSLQPSAAAAAAALCARRGYAGAARKTTKPAVSDEEEDDDGSEFEDMGSDGEFDSDFDDEDLDDGDSDDEAPVKKRGRC